MEYYRVVKEASLNRNMNKSRVRYKAVGAEHILDRKQVQRP